uniref:Uncharacterized protein n=1 Tax=Caenorhabditis japonica TaxID=281687 RepID=A0A8R1IH20_CAEJA
MKEERKKERKKASELTLAAFFRTIGIGGKLGGQCMLPPARTHARTPARPLLFAISIFIFTTISIPSGVILPSHSSRFAFHSHLSRTIGHSYFHPFVPSSSTIPPYPITLTHTLHPKQDDTHCLVFPLLHGDHVVDGH